MELLEHLGGGLVYFVGAFLVLGFISVVTIVLTEFWRWFNREKEDK